MLPGFFEVHQYDGHGRSKTSTVRASEVAAITYGRSDAYRGIAGVTIVLNNGEHIKTTDDAEFVQAAFARAVKEAS